MGAGRSDFDRLIDAATERFPSGQFRWHPGEVAWALGDSGDPERLIWGPGVAWWGEEGATVVAATADEVELALEWAESAGLPVQAMDTDPVLMAAIEARGWVEAVALPFELDLRLPTPEATAAELPAGYSVRPAGPGDDLVSVHRAAWNPSDLPFAPGAAPGFDPDATSSFSTEKLTAVQSSRLYWPELHVVVEAPDGSLAASCIAWLEPVSGIAAIEPLGVHPDHRRRGLAGALCLAAAQLVTRAGGRELVIHPRGDDAYPAPRGAYLRAGFTPVGRTRLFTSPANCS